jgi:hypothetical protein
MTSPEEIIKIADTRLEESKLLLNNKYYSGAFYLAGYSVELYLKAKICQSFGIDDLFSDTNPIEGIGKVREAVKIHNLILLLIYSGLKPKYDELIKNKPDMKQNISILMRD